MSLQSTTARAAACPSRSRPGCPGMRSVERAVRVAVVRVRGDVRHPRLDGSDVPCRTSARTAPTYRSWWRSVRTWDRATQSVRTLPLMSLGFSYRDSLLKRSMRGGADDGAAWSPSPRYVVLSVTFHTRMASLSAPVRYAQLAAALGVDQGTRVPDHRGARRGAGPAAFQGHGARRAQITTPGVQARSSPTRSSTHRPQPHCPTTPRAFPRVPGRRKVPSRPARRGSSSTRASARASRWATDARASLSTKHTLALTNRGGASAADLLELARAVRDGVAEAFGIVLVPEPVLVGAAL